MIRQGVHIPFLMMPLLIKEASHHALILTSSIAELEAWWDYLLDQPRKAKLKDFLNVRSQQSKNIAL